MRMASLIGSPRGSPLPLRSADNVRHLDLERRTEHHVHPHKMTASPYRGLMVV